MLESSTGARGQPNAAADRVGRDSKEGLLRMSGYRATGTKKTRRLMLAAAFAQLPLLLSPAVSQAQTFGQFTTAAVSSLGEGNVFFSAGQERAETGLAARFEMTEKSDLGLQTAYTRTEDVDSWGAGLDYKFYLINEGSSVPVDIASDLSYGYIRGGGFSRSVFLLSVLASGKIVTGEAVDFEPYGSVGFIGEWFHDKGRCGRGGDSPDDWPCEGDDWKAGSGLMIRLGLKTWLSEDLQICIEVEHYEKTTAGGALNVVF